jgi:hypothetical protein
LDAFKSFRLGQVIDNDGTDGSSIIGIGNGSESLLSGSVPDLIFDGFIFEMNSFGGKLYSNCGFGIHCKRVLNESGQEIGLTYTRIANHDYLEEEIELLLL